MDPLLTLQLFFYIILALLGLLVGSFLNVVIYRFPLEKSIIHPSSACVHCKTPISAIDLIPLLSFIMLKGRCRSCGNPISRRYPLVELLTAIIFTWTFFYFGLTPQFLQYVVFFCLLLVISFIDLDLSIIPNRLVLILFFWSVGWQIFYPPFPLFSAALGLLAGGGLFYFIAVLSKGGMGGGDVKLMAVLGFVAGWPLVLIVFLLAFLLGAAVGITMMIAGKKTRRDPLPFGPFLSISFFISIFWGVEIWEWYMQFIS